MAKKHSVPLNILSSVVVLMGFFLLISPGKPLLSYVSRRRQKSPLAKKELTRAEGHISSMNFNSVTFLSSSWVIFL